MQYKEPFGGVDLFGPTAAKVSLGYDLDKVGPASDEYKMKLPMVHHDVLPSRIEGTIMDVDKYGNVTTNLTVKDLDTAGIRLGEKARVTVKKTTIEVWHKNTYGNVSKGEPVLITYEGMVQLAVNEGNFARKFEVARGDEVFIRR